MNWKEELKSKDGQLFDIIPFIETEVIEKLIEDAKKIIADSAERGLVYDGVRSGWIIIELEQLRAKWLDHPQ